MLSFELITRDQELSFRKIVMEYWQFVVPSSFLLTNPVQAEAEYQSRYRWNGGNNNPYWIKFEGQPIGFFMMRVYQAGTAAYIHDFYLVEEARGKKHGSALYHLLRDYLKNRGVNQIYLSVQADNPRALAFWENQGFQIIYHRLAQSI